MIVIKYCAIRLEMRGQSNAIMSVDWMKCEVKTIGVRGTYTGFYGGYNTLSYQYLLNTDG